MNKKKKGKRQPCLSRPLQGGKGKGATAADKESLTTVEEARVHMQRCALERANALAGYQAAKALEHGQQAQVRKLEAELAALRAAARCSE